MAVILVAAASEHDPSVERLRNMPGDERSRLLKNLRDFDLELTPEQQAAIREMDRRLAALSPDQRAHYLTVLRRYHAWLSSLPEQRQNELAAKPPGERTALIRKLIQEHPVPLGESPPLLRVIEPGEYSPFEVASAYKIWQLLSERQRAELEHVNAEQTRRESLFRIGAKGKNAIPRETTPHDFDEEKWLDQTKVYLGRMRPMVMLESLAKSKTDETVKKRVDTLRPEILRRQAINHYVSQAKVRPVDPERLARFIAALPPWIPPSFDSLSPDEARRRLTFAYRLVFPEPEEIGAIRKPAEGAAKSHATPTPKAGTPSTPKRKPAADGEVTTPF
jgi:Protein of unknown function (DUF3106)